MQLCLDSQDHPHPQQHQELENTRREVWKYKRISLSPLPFDTRGPEPGAYFTYPRIPRPRGFKLRVFDPFQNINILHRDFCISQYFTYNI